MNLNVILPITFGGLMLALGALNELQWRRRLWNHVLLTGRVVDVHSDGDGGCFPEIEYQSGGISKTFRSSFSIGRTPFVGESIEIVTNTDGENAEYFTNKSRWYFTIIPIIAGMVSIAIALL